MPDLMSLGGLDAEPNTSGAPAASTSTDAGDPAVWTLLGEAGTDKNGQIAVGSTMLNRARRASSDIKTIATDPEQGYEAWTDKKALARTQKSYPVGSDAYNAAAQTLADLQSGATPVQPYTHFYGPKAQAALGRQPPSWSVGQDGTDIGGNRFYTLPTTGVDLMSLGGAGDGSVVDAKTGEALNPAQTAYFDKRRQAGTIDPNAKAGTEKLPYVVRSPTDQPPADSYYVDLNGDLHAPPSKDPILATAGQLVQDFSNPGIVGMHAVGVDLGQNVDPRARAFESGFGSGVLLGGKNELTAGIESAPSLLTGNYGQTFGHNLLRADRSDAALTHDYPVAHGAGAVAGALGGAVAGDALLGAGLRGTGFGLDQIDNPFLRIGAKSAVRAAQGAAIGGTQGYLSGGLDSQGREVPNALRVEEGAQGAGTGALLNVALPAAGSAVLGVSRAAKLARPPVGDAAQQVQSALQNALARDSMTGDQLLTASKANPLAAPFHAGGPNIASLAEVAAKSPGPAQTLIRDAITEHQGEMPSRIKADIGTAIGGQGDYLATLDKAIETRSQNASAGIEKLRTAPVTLSDDGVQALRSDLAKGAIKSAAQNALASTDPAIRESGAALNRVADTALDNPSELQLTVGGAQAISKSLLDAADGAFRSGDGARGTALKTLGRAIRNDAATSNPDYAAWLKNYGDDSDNLDALNLGHNVFSGAQSNTTAQVEKTLKAMGPAAQDMYRKGVAEALIDKVRTSEYGVGGMRQLLRNEELRDKVRIAFPDDESFNNFIQSAQQRVSEQNLNNRVMGGSPTYPLQATRADLEAQPFHPLDAVPHALEVGGHILTGNIPGLAGKALKEALKNIPRQDRSVLGNPTTNLLLGRALTDHDVMENLLTAPNGPRALNNSRLRVPFLPLGIEGINLLRAPSGSGQPAAVPAPAP